MGFGNGQSHGEYHKAAKQGYYGYRIISFHVRSIASLLPLDKQMGRREATMSAIIADSRR